MLNIYCRRRTLNDRYLYTERKDSKDWIFYNDLYFNLNTGNEDMSQKEIDLIQQVDEAKLTQDKHIETKYGLGTIRNLSSGCKTLLNIVKHPDKVVNVDRMFLELFLLWIILRFLCQDQRFLISRMTPKSDLMILI